MPRSDEESDRQLPAYPITPMRQIAIILAYCVLRIQNKRLTVAHYHLLSRAVVNFASESCVDRLIQFRLTLNCVAARGWRATGSGRMTNLIRRDVATGLLMHGEAGICLARMREGKVGVGGTA